jgi:glutathione S-transferase
MPITMYDLAGAEAERRFSPFCWRSRMALAHKGLAVETVPWRFTEKDRLPQPNQGRVPVIVDDGRVIHDSNAIADYLEERYADRPSLFGDETSRALTLCAELDRDGVADRADPPRSARHPSAHRA